MCRWHKAGAAEREINGKERCILPTLPAEPREDWIWDQLSFKLGMEKEKHFTPLLQDNHFDDQIAIQEAKIESITKALAQKERGKKRLDEQIDLAKDDDDYNPTEFHFKRKTFTADVKRLRQELEAARQYLVWNDRNEE